MQLFYHAFLILPSKRKPSMIDLFLNCINFKIVIQKGRIFTVQDQATVGLLGQGGKVQAASGPHQGKVYSDR